MQYTLLHSLHCLHSAHDSGQEAHVRLQMGTSCMCSVPDVSVLSSSLQPGSRSAILEPSLKLEAWASGKMGIMSHVRRVYDRHVATNACCPLPLYPESIRLACRSVLCVAKRDYVCSYQPTRSSVHNGGNMPPPPQVTQWLQRTYPQPRVDQVWRIWCLIHSILNVLPGVAQRLLQLGQRRISSGPCGANGPDHSER